LTDTATTGGWSTSNSSIATVNYSTGVVAGVAAGTAVISYTYPTTGCYATKTVTVNPVLSAGVISGTSNLAVGGTTTLTDPILLGVWTSSNTSIATVNSTTGLVTGVAPGAVAISYTVTNACGTSTATKTMFVGGTVWYSVTTGGDASVLTNWWSVNNNTGTHPTSFANGADTWYFKAI